MKRNRRVGKETASANLFITQFKLKASQSTNKEHKHRKMNTTMGNFKQILLKDDSRKERQSVNGRQKPLLEQLKFKNKEDDFRPPQSITKRSISKMKEESRLKFGNQTNDFFDTNQQQPSIKKDATDKSRAIAQYFASKPHKPITQKSVLKQKLEKTALQKFNSVVLKENQENQNVVSEKAAQVLYIMLKTARMSKFRQGAILKSQPGQQNHEFYEQMIAKNKVTEIQNNYLNEPIYNNTASNSYFLKENKKKSQQLLLESKSKANYNQNQQQSSFGVSKRPIQTHPDQIEEPKKSIYEQFDKQEEDFSQQSSFDDMDLKAQSSIPLKKNDLSKKLITKDPEQQKKIDKIPSNQVPLKQNKNLEKQQFKVGFNFVPKVSAVNQFKNQQKFQSIADKLAVDERKKSAKINPYDSEKDSKKSTKVQANIPKFKDQKDLYDLKKKEKIESIVGEQMISLKAKTKIESIVGEQMVSLKNKDKIQSKVGEQMVSLKNKDKIQSKVGEQMFSLKNKDKIQSIVDNITTNDKKQIKHQANVRKDSLKSNYSKEEDIKSNLYSVPSEIQSIPQADVVIRKNDGEKKHQQSSSKNFISLNNNKIEMILTEDNIKKPSENSKKEIQNNKISLPPPKLSKNTQIKNPTNPKISYNNDIDEDGIQQVNIGIKKQLFPQSSNHQKSQPKAIVEKLPPAAQQKINQKSLKQQVAQKKVAAPSPPQNFQQTSQQQQLDELQDQLCFYIERIQDIGMYRIQSKDCYNDKSINKQLVQIHKVCAYYLAHQFLYLANNACSIFKSSPFNRQFFTISIDQLNILKQKEVIDEQIITLQEHLQESKKLLKKSYDQCKTFLQKKEQILLMDAKISYHIKCCSFVIKQFNKVYELKKKNPKLQTLTKRCAYLINLYCNLRLLNGQQLKQHQSLEEIENLSEYVEKYKHFLESQ